MSIPWSDSATSPRPEAEPTDRDDSPGSGGGRTSDDGTSLRAWQARALAQFESSPERNFLAVATPGAGKTTFALTAARRALVARSVRRLVIVVPTQHLKHQWAHAAERMDIHLDPDWAVGYGGLPSDVHGVVVTYQQVAAAPAQFRPLVRGAFVLLDEIHHAGDSRSWGDGVRLAFEPAWRRLCLSGTPFRSDQITIPFVRYDGDLAHADYEYGYGDALADRKVVRPVYFPRINGRMEWTAPDGQTYEATFDDRLARELASQRLRTALDVSGEWLPTVLAQANAQLMHLRARDPRAAALAIAIDQDHARGIAAILAERTGITPIVATSDDPAASKKLWMFSEGSSPWIVAVRMVSEGVDIPRLRVGVYATNTITELFFRQAVGRLVRWNARLRRQAAYMFIPDDIRLRRFAAAIAEARRHSLQKSNDVDEREREEPIPKHDGEPADPFEQLNLFAAISAVPLDEHGRPLDDARPFRGGANPEEEEDDDDGGGGGGGGEEATGDENAAGEGTHKPAEREIGSLTGELIPDLAAAPSAGKATPVGATGQPPARQAVPAPEVDPDPPFSGSVTGGAGAPTVAVGQKKGLLARRRELRELNSDAVRDLVHLTGKTHADVNADLNRKVGVRRISLASIKQLEQRLTLAKAMLRRR